MRATRVPLLLPPQPFHCAGGGAGRRGKFPLLPSIGAVLPAVSRRVRFRILHTSAAHKKDAIKLESRTKGQAGPRRPRLLVISTTRLQSFDVSPDCPVTSLADSDLAGSFDECTGLGPRCPTRAV